MPPSLTSKETSLIFLQAECHFALIPGRLHEYRTVARREESGQVTTLTQTCGSQRRVSSDVSRPGGGEGAGLASCDHVTTEAAPLQVARFAVTSAYGAGR